MKPIRVIVVKGSLKNFNLQWIDPATGKRKTLSSGTDSIRKAKAIAADKERELNSIKRGDGSLSWSDFILRYSMQHLVHHGEKNETKALGVLDCFYRECKPTTISDVSVQMLTEYHGYLATLRRSQFTIAGHFRQLHAALNWAVSQRLLHECPPMPTLKLPKRKARGRPLTINELTRMLRALTHFLDRPLRKHWRRFMVGLWLSGLRLSEALSLRWEPGPWPWIDSTRWQLRIPAENDKAGVERILPIVPDWRRHLAFAKDRSGHVYYCPGWNWKPVQMARVSERIADCGRIAGVVVDPATGRTATAHDFRRTFGTRWASVLTPLELMTLMRHSSFGTTKGFYAMLEADNLGKSIESKLLNNRLNTNAPPP